MGEDIIKVHQDIDYARFNNNNKITQLQKHQKSFNMMKFILALFALFALSSAYPTAPAGVTHFAKFNLGGNGYAMARGANGPYVRYDAATPQGPQVFEYGYTGYNL